MNRHTVIYWASCLIAGCAMASGGITISDLETYILIACFVISYLTGVHDGETK